MVVRTTMGKEEAQEKRSSLRDLAYVFFRRKWVIIGIVLSTVIPVTVYTFFLIPPAYIAQTKLLIKPGRENIYVAPVGDPGGMRPPTIIQRVAQLISSEIQIIKSRVVVRRAIEQLRVARLSPNSLPGNSMAGHAEDEESVPIEVAVNQALKKLSASRMRGTDIIRVGFRSHDPNTSFKFVTTIVNQYLERHLEVHQSEKTYDFFKAQSNQLEQELRTSARKLADFKKRYGIVSFNQLKRLTVEKYTNVSTAKNNNEAMIEVTQTRIDKLEEDLSRISEHKYTGQDENPEGGVVNSLKGRLIKLEVEKLRLLSKYKPDFRVARIDEETDKLEEMLADEQEEFHGSVSTGLSGAYQKTESQLLGQEVNLEALYTKGAEIKKQLIQYGQELERLGRLEPELRALERSVSVNDQNFRLYLTKFEESRVSDAMDAAKMVSVTVLEPATIPLNPIPVNKALNFFVSLCIGGVAGLGLAFLLEYFDHTFRVPEDIKDNLKVPLLGTIEDLPTKERGDLETLAASPTPPLHYQILKSNVMMYAGKKIKTLSICSPTPGEGSSTVALNLATSLAKENGDRVALVDANLRQPVVHTICNLPASPGFSEVINEGTSINEAMKQSVIPNLFVLTSGVSPPNPMVIFESPKLADLIEVLRTKIDWIIFDCAPIDIYPDATVLARQLDGVALVIQAENVGAEVAIRAKELLEQAGAKILGAVLNRQRQIIPERIYKRLS
jgi:capsular exopolysaccharide synthesis family protein